MNQYTGLPMRAALVAAVVVALFAPAALAEFNSGSTGADGELNPNVDTEIVLPASGILNYTSVNIPAGVTVKFKRNAANTPVYMLVSGNASIAGTIDIRGGAAAATGTYGDGAQSDDGAAGSGGPGGYAGGRGGRDDAQQRIAIIRGGAGVGPGGGPGGLEGANGCNADTGYYKYVGTGGGYASTALKYYVRSQCSMTTPAGASYGSELLQPLIGGSGGGGGRGGTNFHGSGGGGGGGAILIATSGTLNLTGTIDATGGDGGGLDGAGVGGQGAGASGGAIRLVATSVTGSGTLRANGGCINYNNARRQRCGFSGSNEFGGAPGRIRVEGDTVTYNGVSTPAFVRGDVSPVFIANAPGLRIASVAGQAVPIVPTGTDDVVLPAETTGPVVVGFETSNIPVGNTVHLKIIPVSGIPTEAISRAITGSTATGVAEVSVVLPQGANTLQATSTYTVIVASLDDPSMRDKLDRLAGDQRVEKVEVTAGLQGAPRARLITDSGDAFEVPYEALSAIGFDS